MSSLGGAALTHRIPTAMSSFEEKLARAPSATPRLLQLACRAYLSDTQQLRKWTLPFFGECTFGGNHREQVQNWLLDSESLTVAAVETYKKEHAVKSGGSFDRTLGKVAKRWPTPGVEMTSFH